jgi:hypothetical protein
LSDTLILVALTAAITVPSMAIGWRRGRRRVDPDWRRRWKSVERSRRRRIARAVRAGRAVDDPRDAELAAELAQKVTVALPKMRRHVLLLLTSVAIVTVTALLVRDMWLVAYESVSIVLAVVATALLWRARRRAADAEAANRTRATSL